MSADPVRMEGSAGASGIVLSATRVAASRWTLAPPFVQADMVLRLQKHRHPAEVQGPIRDAAEAMAAEARRLAAPEAAVWRGPVTGMGPDGDVTLDGVHRFRSRALVRLLAPAEAAWVVVLTLGEALERAVDGLFEEERLLEGLFLDTAGWAAIEILMRQVRGRLLLHERPAGRVVTHRIAPGYQDWPVDEQAALLRVFGDLSLPVRVTESAWMLPRKSVSAVFGVCRRSWRPPWKEEA